jgi:hypothetical protein
VCVCVCVCLTTFISCIDSYNYPYSEYIKLFYYHKRTPSYYLLWLGSEMFPKSSCVESFIPNAVVCRGGDYGG